MQARIRLKPLLKNGRPRYCRWGTVPKKSTSAAAAASPVHLVQGRLCGCTKKPETKCWETQSLRFNLADPRFNTVEKVRAWAEKKGYKASKVDLAAVPPAKAAAFRKQGCACDCKKLKTKTSCGCECKE